MKNALFTGIIGENPAVLINREQAPGIEMPRRWREASLLHLRCPSLLLQVYYFK